MAPYDDNDGTKRSTSAEAVDDPERGASEESTDAASQVETHADSSSVGRVLSDPPVAGAGQEHAATKAELGELQREKDALQDRLLRLAAEFDNYRKRVDRDRRDQADAAVASAVEDLLPIVDNLERALDVPAGSDADSYRQGVELIYRQMLELLRRRGVTPIESVGTDFDPELHQAVTHEVSPEHREGEVIEEFRRGYTLGDRLLRPALVKVAKA